MSPTYDRLEAGRPQGKQVRRFGWKKFALGAGFLLVLVWLFVPKESRTVSFPNWSGSSTFEKGALRTGLDELWLTRVISCREHAV
jgi:hypothetical protein